MRSELEVSKVYNRLNSNWNTEFVDPFNPHSAVWNASSRKRSQSSDQKNAVVLLEYPWKVRSRDTLLIHNFLTIFDLCRQHEEARFEEFQKQMDYSDAFDYINEFYRSRPNKGSSSSSQDDAASELPQNRDLHEIVRFYNLIRRRPRDCYHCWSTACRSCRTRSRTKASQCIRTNGCICGRVDVYKVHHT